VIAHKQIYVDRFIWPALLICLMNLSGCSGQQETVKEEKVKKTEQQVIVKPGSSYQDTLIVNSISAVFFMADSVQMEKFGKVVSLMALESFKHDCFYQMRNSRTVLKASWPKVNMIEAVNKRYLLFIKEDGTKVCTDIDKLDACGLLLFNRKKDPQNVDMTNIDTELRYYFDF